MLTRNTWRLAAVAVVLAIVAFRVAPDPQPSEREVRRAVERGDAKSSSTAPNRVDVARETPASAAATSRVAPTPSASPNAPTDRPPSRAAAGAPVELQVDLPAEVALGDEFEARIHVHANVAVRQLMFAVAYDKARLVLVGSTAGNFARQGNGQAEFGAEEPSDGNIQVSLDAHKSAPLSGAGELATLRFQAIKRGASRVALQNVTLLDGTQLATANTVVLERSVAIR